MSNYRRGNHTVTRLTVHVVWVTKYRYHVLTGEIQKRCRELIMQVCDAEDVKILSGVVSKDHVHILIEYPPSASVSDLVRKMKGRSSRLLQVISHSNKEVLLRKTRKKLLGKRNKLSIKSRRRKSNVRQALE
jgi:REP element-mobilizing transposase RayT